ncbi:MAG: hypothetical protein AB1601_16880 [Planctomycetota bacterium]
MKRLLCVICAATLVAPAMAYYAGTLWVADSYGTTNGGEYVAHPSGNWSAHRINPVPPLFETFCVEKNEYLNFGSGYTFQVDIDPYVVRGGVGANPPPYPQLSPKTAWLYCQFIKGQLNGYVYTDSGNINDANDPRVQSANALQNVIWYYENEIANWASGLSGSTLALAQHFYNLAEAANPQDIGCTRVMNLWRKDNPWGWGAFNAALGRYEYQSLLVCVPAPAAAMLGVIGLGLVGWVKRRLS